MRNWLAFGILCLACAAPLAGAGTFDMYVVDTEGGKALLLISPSGQSMLVDAGFPGFNGRDAIRIAEAAKAAGVTKFDWLVVTHYDVDHVGNVPDTVARVPAAAFVDHGPPVVNDQMTARGFAAYQEAASGARRIVVKPGDRIPFTGVDVLVITAGFEAIRKPVQGGGGPNPYCAETQPKSWEGTDEDVSENAASVGLLYTFGKFRMLDLADLTWNKEMALMCPANPIGAVDLFMVSHHGHDISNSPALVKAIRPRVTIMNNGARKMGLPATLKLIRSVPVEAAYQLHWSANAPADNPPPEFIANLQDSSDGNWIKVSAERTGAFTVTNGRTGESRTFGK